MWCAACWRRTQTVVYRWTRSGCVLLLRRLPYLRTQLTVQEHPWVTDNGREPMISTWDNLYTVGQQVEEPTKEELRKAISTKSVL